MVAGDILDDRPYATSGWTYPVRRLVLHPVLVLAGSRRVHCQFRHCLAAQCGPTRRTRNVLPHLYPARGSQANLPDGVMINSARQALWSLPIDRNQNRTILCKPASARFLCGSISCLVGDLIQRAQSHRIKRRSDLACRVTKTAGSVPKDCSKAFPRRVPPVPRSNPDEGYAGCSVVRTDTP